MKTRSLSLICNSFVTELPRATVALRISFMTATACGANGRAIVSMELSVSDAHSCIL
jgi:hypothetical protein